MSDIKSSEILPATSGGGGKPKWLRKLERESWQAELIISGAAILGSLQLPGLLERAEVYCLLHFDRDTLFICYLAAIYWRILTYCLIAAFIFHFVVRALWIGMVGLNSVYTEGFKPNERFAQHYQEKVKEEYGNIDGYIFRLDRLGSGIFGVSFSAALVFLNFGLIGTLIVYLHSWLISWNVPSSYMLLALGLVFLPLFLLSVGGMILQTSKLREGPLARRYLWPITKTISRLSYPVAGRYIITANNLVTSHHADSKSFGWSVIGGFLLFMVIVLVTVFNAPYTRYFVDGAYHRMGSDSTLVRGVGEEGKDLRGIQLHPLMGEVENTSLTFWIPAPEREWSLLMSQCEQPEVDEDLERNERQGQLRLRELDCARAYYTFSLNGQQVNEYVIKRQYFSNDIGEQRGFHVYVPAVGVRLGSNLLQVVSNYPHEETGELRSTYATFYHGLNKEVD